MLALVPDGPVVGGRSAGIARTRGDKGAPPRPQAGGAHYARLAGRVTYAPPGQGLLAAEWVRVSHAHRLGGRREWMREMPHDCSQAARLPV